MSEEDVTHWIDQVKDGDSAAAYQLWQHYYAQLVRLTRQQLRGHATGVADEDDIIVSVFESFYRAAEGGRFPDLTSRDDLWRLLLRMSARKIIDKRRHDGRQRRGAGVEVLSIHAEREDDQEMIEVIGNEPTPEMVLSMKDSFQELISHLGSGQLTEIAIGKMEGYSNAELAERLRCSERTIERRLNLIREKCQQELMPPSD